VIGSLQSPLIGTSTTPASASGGSGVAGSVENPAHGVPIGFVRAIRRGKGRGKDRSVGFGPREVRGDFGAFRGRVRGGE